MLCIEDIQHRLNQYKVDGWLLYDFRGSNQIACSLLGVDQSTHATRRWFYWIPARGECIKLVSTIEPHVLNSAPGIQQMFLSQADLEQKLISILTGVRSIAMEYSPCNRLPYIARVDSGTIEFIRSLKIDVRSSGAFLQYFSCVWSDKQLKSHLYAAAVLQETVLKTWDWIVDHERSGKKIDERAVQLFMQASIVAAGCETDGLPICAAGINTASPHYTSDPHHSAKLKKGDLILLDLWCKQQTSDAVYADITKMAILDDHIDPEYDQIFKIVRTAQKKTIAFIQNRLAQEKVVLGCEADGVARAVISEAGFGSFFIHRTGHNIHTTPHGPGAHLDGFETQDERPLIPRTCFSIEPGIYCPGKFGIRLECNGFITDQHNLLITGGEQEEIHTLLS